MGRQTECQVWQIKIQDTQFKFQFQINKFFKYKYILNISWDILILKKLSIAYLEPRFNWASYFLCVNPKDRQGHQCCDGAAQAWEEPRGGSQPGLCVIRKGFLEESRSRPSGEGKVGVSRVTRVVVGRESVQGRENSLCNVWEAEGAGGVGGAERSGCDGLSMEDGQMERDAARRVGGQPHRASDAC